MKRKLNVKTEVMGQKMLKKLRGGKRWQKLVSVLGCMVVFCTTYALILPAITMEKPPLCGIEAHEHGESCYGKELACVLSTEEGHVHTLECSAWEQVLSCLLPEAEPHTHDESCMGIIKEQICALEECEPHSHTEACYANEAVLVCTAEENEEHTHDESCYEEQTLLVCDRAETEGHSHSEACYQAVEGLVCGLEETEGHAHTESCYTEEARFLCGKEEGELHAHDDSCYVTQLTCSLPAHAHTLSCYSDRTAGVETQEIWEATLPALSGNAAEDMAAIARSQLGYRSVTANYQVVDEASETLAFYNRYAAWYPDTDPYQDWNALFAAFCMQYAGVENDAELFDVSPDMWGMNLFLAQKLTDPSAEPIGVGDLLFVENEAGEMYASVVSEVNDAALVAIVGDVVEDGSRTVAEQTFALDSELLRGFLDVEDSNESGSVPPTEYEEPIETNLEYDRSWPVVGCIQETDAPAAGMRLMAGAMLLADPVLPDPGKLDIASVYEASMYWKPGDQDPAVNSGWTAIDGSYTLQGNEHIKLQVNFNKLNPVRLQQNDYKMHFTLPTGLERCDTSGTLTIGSRIVGTLVSEADHKHVTITFDRAWVDSLDPNIDQEGNFYITAELDAGALDGSDDPVIFVGGAPIDLNLNTENLLARFGQLDLTKTVADEMVQGTDGKYYLTYTVTVEAGEHGAQQVSVRDLFNDTSNIAAINGVSTTAVTADGNGIAKPKDARISGTAAADGATGTVSLQTLPTPLDSSVSAEYMVWQIGSLGPNEKRELTYTVQLSEKYTSTYHGTNETLDNMAQVFSKDRPRDQDYAHFTTQTNLEIQKSTGNVTENADGTRTIEYVLTVTAPSLNDYTLKNVTIDDSFLNTAYNLDEWVRYDAGSFKVNGAAVADPEFTNNGRGDSRGDGRASFQKLAIGDMAPGQTKTITYTANLAQEAFALGNGQVRVDNTARAMDGSTPERKEAATSRAWVDIEGIQWSRKFIGETLTGSRTEVMNGESFTLNRGALKYEVIVNESGDWNMNQTTIVDAAVNEMLKIVGNVRVDAYLVDENNRPQEGANNAEALAALTSAAPADTKWITGVNGQTGFTQNIGNLGFAAPPEGKNYAYVLTYYAEPDPSRMGSSTSAMIPVGNSLNLSGTVGNGNGKFININTSVTSTTTVSNPNKFNVKKTAWYYERPGEGISGYINGAFYWVVRVDGNQLKQGLIIQDSSNLGSYKNFNHDGKDGSNPAFVGAYVGSLGSDEAGNLYGLSDIYPDAYSLVTSVTDETGDGKLRMLDYEIVNGQGGGTHAPVEVYYGGNITNDNGRTPARNGGGVDVDGKVVYNHDVNVRFRTDYNITPGESLYVVFRSEPMIVPQKGSDTYSFSNKVNYYNNGWTDLGNQAAVQTLYGSDGIQKTVTYPKLFFVNNGGGLRQPGSWNSNLQGSQGPYAIDYDKVRAYQDPAVIGVDRGFYTGWNIRLNGEGKLNGTYRVKEQIPDGMDFVYLRLAGRGAGTSPFTFNEMNDLGPEWVKYTSTPNKYTGESGNGNNGSVSVSSEKTPVIYYKNGNEILFEISSFANGSTDLWADIQVITRVTDTQANNGQATDFENHVQLLRPNNTLVNETYADLTLALSDMIDKDIATSRDGDAFKSSVLPFRIQINDYLNGTDAQTIPDLNPNGTTVNLVDEMSNALIIDPDSVRIYYGKFATDPWTDKSKPDPQRNNRVPNYDESLPGDYKGYTIVITDNAHTMKINNLPDNRIMTMFYNTTVNVAPGQNVSISNDAHWEGVSTPNADSSVNETFKYTSAGALYPQPTVSIRKVDPADAQGSILNGAKFEMQAVLYFDTATNSFVDPATNAQFQGEHAANLDVFHGTTHDGKLLVFGDNRDDHGQATAHNMVYNTIYRLVETEAPEGYVCNSDPYYFIIARASGKDSSGNDTFPNFDEYLRSTSLANAGVYVYYGGAEYTYTAYNSRGRIEITKGFGGNVQSGRPVAGNYYFALYDLAVDGRPLGDPRYRTVISYTENDLAAYDHAQLIGEEYSYKTAQFLDLPLNTPYYLFETDANGNAIPEGGVLKINGQSFVVNYTFPAGTTNHQIIPTVANHGIVHVIGTNNRYEATISKSFADIVGNTLSQGLVGNYNFGIWRAAADGSFNLAAEPLDTQTIVFRIQDSNVSVKKATFSGLIPGTYAIYELDADGSPVLNGSHFSHNSTGTVANEFIVNYPSGNEFTIAPDSPQKQEISAVNNSSVSLPMTGGAGTSLYTLSGLLMISFSLFAGLCLRRVKRKEVQS